MVATADQVREVGPRYDCGIDSPTSGFMGLFVRPGTYVRQQQLIKRQEVVAALTQAIADRDIDFWTRVSQFDWSKGSGQELFADPSRYSDALGIDIHKLGALSLVPMPTIVSGPAAGDIKGRGAALAITAFANGQPAIFFPWLDGKYAFSTDGGGTWSTANTPAGAKIADIATDGINIFFALYNNGGVWQTVTSGPVALVQYDTGANKYSKLIYDPLRKNLYGITTADSAVALHKINAGAGPTIIFDWIKGRLDGLELYQGNVVVSWNLASFTRGAGPSRLYSYDGSTVSRLADMPDGSFVTGLRAALGYLFITTMESDPFKAGVDQGAVYFMLGTSGPTRIDSIDSFYLDDINASTFLGYPYFMFMQGTSLFIATKGRAHRYDIVNGGLSRSFGDDGYGGTSTFILGAVTVRGVIYALLGGIGQGNGSIVKLNPPGAGGLISVSGNAGQRLTSSRFDLGLPYVDKFWYAFEVVCDALIAGQQILMEYSLDDGASWVVCSNSPLATIGTRRFNFLVQQVNAHVRYRVTLVASAGVASPVVHSIAARFAPSNPSLKVWSFTVTAYDSIRSRGSKVEDSYGKDMIAFLEAIAKQSELVTFYEPNDASRTAHNVWVLQAETSELNTSGTYSPLRNEGDVPITLWEV